MRIEPNFQFKSLVLETKAFKTDSVRRVRDTEFWGLPYGTPLVGRGDGQPLDLLSIVEDETDSDDDFIVVQGKSGTFYRVSWFDDDPNEWFAQKDDGDEDTDDVLLTTKGKTPKEAMEKALRGVQDYEQSLQVVEDPQDDPTPQKPSKPAKAKKEPKVVKGDKASTTPKGKTPKAKGIAPKLKPVTKLTDKELAAELDGYVQHYSRGGPMPPGGASRLLDLNAEDERRTKGQVMKTAAPTPQSMSVSTTPTQRDELDYIHETAVASAIYYNSGDQSEVNPAHVGVDDWSLDDKGKLTITSQQGWDHLARELDHYITIYEETAEDEYDAGLRKENRAKARILKAVRKKMPDRPTQAVDKNKPVIGERVKARTDKGHPATVQVVSIDDETSSSFVITGHRIGKRGGVGKTKETFVVRKATPGVSDDISRQGATKKPHVPADAMARWFDQLQEVEQIRSEARQAKTGGRLSPEKRKELDKRVFLSERVMVSDLPHITLSKDERQDIGKALRNLSDKDLSDDYGSLAILSAIPHFIDLWEKAMAKEEDLLAKGATPGSPAMLRVNRSLMRHEASIKYGITLALKRASDRPKVSDADGEALSVGNRVWIDAAGPNLPSDFLGYPATITGITREGKVRIRVEARTMNEDATVLVDKGKERLIDPRYLTQQPQ